MRFDLLAWLTSDCHKSLALMMSVASQHFNLVELLYYTNLLSADYLNRYDDSLWLRLRKLMLRMLTELCLPHIKSFEYFVTISKKNIHKPSSAPQTNKIACELFLLGVYSLALLQVFYFSKFVSLKQITITVLPIAIKLQYILNRWFA